MHRSGTPTRLPARSGNCFRALLQILACVSLYQVVTAQWRKARLRMGFRKPDVSWESTICVDEMTLPGIAQNSACQARRIGEYFEVAGSQCRGVSGRIHKGEGT